MNESPYYRFELSGTVKPYVRMTQRGKWCRPEAREYLASKASLAAQMWLAMSRNGWTILPRRTPLRCYLMLSNDKVSHRCDLDNIVKAMLDAAQGVVFPNDCWIDSIWASRNIGDERITFGVGVFSEWRGQVDVVRTVDDALRVVGALEPATR